MGMVKKFCTDAVLLHKGRMITSGDPDEVADRYRELIEEAQEKYSRADDQDRGLDDMLEREEEEDLEGVGSRGGSARDGSAGQEAKEAEILGVQVLDEKGVPADEVPSGSRIAVRVHARYAAALEESTIGITLRSKRAKVDVFSTDTTREEAPLGPKSAGEEATVDFAFEVPLRPGTYTVGAAVSATLEEDPSLEQAENETSFKITNSGSELSFGSMIHLPTQVEIHDPGSERERPTRSA
jgi:hypothetical protein